MMWENTLKRENNYPPSTTSKVALENENESISPDFRTTLSTVNLFHDKNSRWIVSFSEPDPYSKERGYPPLSLGASQQGQERCWVEAWHVSVLPQLLCKTFWKGQSLPQNTVLMAHLSYLSFKVQLKSYYCPWSFSQIGQLPLLFPSLFNSLDVLTLKSIFLCLILCCLELSFNCFCAYIVLLMH